ncbi:DUF300-domain-containing protein [Hysterangium stoloniferum]|nr:DUF300-domain-containing protein [Hysterangium stoloniferum]
MIPIYAIASFISLFSLNAAFFIDAIRDVYEAFVIYVFFQLLIGYLGGERSLLILLHGRPPVHPIFPLNLFKRELDASDPYTYLWLKRGILQYVQVKPILAAATIILKALGKFDEGNLKAGSGYLYISIAYNISIGVALYCLAMFWMVVNTDLKPFRPMPKFLCVKGILFFSFWQSFLISILVAADVIQRLGPYTEPSYISLALTDLLICLEMPLFAIAHMYAFSHTDYIDHHLQYAGRMPLRHAFRDAFGLKDVFEDIKATFGGEGMDYRAFEPAEGKMHQGSGRDRRIRAGLRYAHGGRRKYWLPMRDADVAAESGVQRGGGGLGEEAYAPQLEGQARAAVRDETTAASDDEDDGLSLTYSDPDTSDDELYEYSRGYLFGDYNYPCIDVSGETARHAMWEEEERVLRDQRAAYFSHTLNPNVQLPGKKDQYGKRKGMAASNSGYGATGIGAGAGVSKGTDAANIDYLAENRGNLIDFDGDRISDNVVDGVRMHWSRKGKVVLDQRRNSGSGSKSGSGSPVVSPRNYIPNSSSPSLLRRASSPLAAKSTLPHDAVDLVIEDPDVASGHATGGLKGGSGIASPSREPRALRQVYRQGVTAQDFDGGDGDVDHGVIDREELDEEPQSVDSKVLKERGEEDEYRMLRDADSVEATDVKVTKTQSPPQHAQPEVDVSRYTLAFEEENPWL